MRRTARECVLKMLYAYQFVGEVDEEFKGRMYLESGLDEKGVAFANRLLSAVLGHYDELAEEIQSLAIGYEKGRIFKIDMAVMLIAAAEIRYLDDIPPAVSADEAVGLASKYSTENSLSFINGILAKYIKIYEGKKDENN